MTVTTRELIDDFLQQRRLAVVGVSRDPKNFANTLFRELRQRDYDVVPVNPNAKELEGLPCFRRVQDIRPAVDGALLLTAPEVTNQVVRDCAEAGISRLWLHRGGGQGAVSQTAIDYCSGNGISVVAGHCPFMFLPDTGFGHRLHGFVKKLAGSYPK